MSQSISVGGCEFARRLLLTGPAGTLSPAGERDGVRGRSSTGRSSSAASKDSLFSALLNVSRTLPVWRFVV